MCLGKKISQKFYMSFSLILFNTLKLFVLLLYQRGAKLRFGNRHYANIIWKTHNHPFLDLNSIITKQRTKLHTRHLLNKKATYLLFLSNSGVVDKRTGDRKDRKQSDTSKLI